MKQVTVTVIDPVGLHARPATVAVNAASKFKSDITMCINFHNVPFILTFNLNLINFLPLFPTP